MWGTNPSDPDGLTQFKTEGLAFQLGEWNVGSSYGQHDPAPFRDKPQGEAEQAITGLTLEWDLNDSLTLKSITGYVAL